jgi:hypothetical protein
MLQQLGNLLVASSFGRLVMGMVNLFWLPMSSVLFCAFSFCSPFALSLHSWLEWEATYRSDRHKETECSCWRKHILWHSSHSSSRSWSAAGHLAQSSSHASTYLRTENPPKMNPIVNPTPADLVSCTPVLLYIVLTSHHSSHLHCFISATYIPSVLPVAIGVRLTLIESRATGCCLRRRRHVAIVVYNI